MGPAGPFDELAEAIVGLCLLESYLREQFLGFRMLKRSGSRARDRTEDRAIGNKRAVARHIERR